MKSPMKPALKSNLKIGFFLSLLLSSELGLSQASPATAPAIPEVKPVDSKPVETKPTETKPADVKPKIKKSDVRFSDAYTLFRRVDYYLTEYYRGPSSVAVQPLLDDYRSKLAKTCDGHAKCEYGTAEKLVRQLIGTLNDGHTYLMSPEKGGIFGNFWQYKLGYQAEPYGTTGAMILTSVKRESGAEAAGLRRGDLILKMNGRTPKGFKLEQDQPQKVTVLLRRAGHYLERTVTSRLWRPQNNWPSLKRVQGVAVLRVPSFYDEEGDGTQIAGEIHRLIRQAQNQKISRMVVDVRDNGGGNLTNCLLAANAFIPQMGYKLRHSLADLGFVIKEGAFSMQGLRPLEGQNFFEMPPQKLEGYTRWNKPVTVLVNKNTASCGENFAYFIQHYQRGLVIGESTYGVANSATRFFDLAGNYAMGVTIGQLHNLDGSPLPHLITPDLAIKDDLEQINQTGRDTLLERGILEVKQARG